MGQVATPTSLDQEISFASPASLVSTSVSPAADALVFALIGWRQAASRTWDSVTSGFSTVAGWTRIESAEYGSSLSQVGIAYARTTASPGSGSVTSTWSGNVQAPKMQVVQIATEFDTVNPIAQSHSAGHVAGSPELTTFSADLPSTPHENSIILSVAWGRAVVGTVSAFTSWTEIAQNTASSAPWNTQYVDGSNGTEYGVIFGTAPDNAIAIMAVEVQEPQVADADGPPPERAIMRGVGRGVLRLAA